MLKLTSLQSRPRAGKIVAALFASLLVLLISQTANAAVFDFPDVKSPDFGPALSGSGVLYGEVQRDSDSNIADFIHVRRLEPGGSPVNLATFDVGNQLHRLDLAGSADVFTANLTTIDDCGGGEGEPFLPCVVGNTFANGLLTATPKQGRGCTPGFPRGSYGGDLFQVQPMVAVSGTRIASTFGGTVACDASSQIQVTDGAGLLPTVTVPVSAKHVKGLSLAGRYLAWSESVYGSGRVEITLFDTITSTIVRKTALRTTRYSWVSFDVQENGMIALNGRLLSNKKRRGRLLKLCGNAAPQTIVTIDPNGAVNCTGISSTPNGVRLARDIVMTYAQHGKLRQRLTTLDLRSGDRRIHRTTTTADYEDFDFDGDRVAWFEKECVGWRMRVAEYAPSLETPQTRCPVHVGTRVLNLKGFSRATVPITCPNGCSGHWSISAPSRIADESSLHDGEITIEDGAFMTYPAAAVARQHEFRFYRHVRNWVRRNKPRRITLKFTSYSASIDGINASKAVTFRVRYR